jgi:hypothetical protein
MKRSFLMSALVLGLAGTMAMTACGGGGGSGEPAKDGDSAGKEGGGGSEDPVVELQGIADGIQKDVDALFQPIKDADAVLESVAKLPADLKAAKSKVDPKKLMAELKKIVEGADPQLEALKLEEDAKKMVQERIDKVKALVKSVKEIDEAVKALGTRIAEATPKIPAIGAKAIAKVEVALKNPLAGADTKKKAEEDKAKIQGIIDGFKTKVGEWQKLITDMPAKAKDIPKKFATAFK